jgi:hypothetical protein
MGSSIRRRFDGDDIGDLRRVLGVDGVALKQAVNAWASAPAAEKAARFAVAEGMRWLEWGTRSYESFTLGLAVMLCAIAMVKRVARSSPT